MNDITGLSNWQLTGRIASVTDGDLTEVVVELTRRLTLNKELVDAARESNDALAEIMMTQFSGYQGGWIDEYRQLVKKTRAALAKVSER